MYCLDLENASPIILIDSAENEVLERLRDLIIPKLPRYYSWYLYLQKNKVPSHFFCGKQGTKGTKSKSSIYYSTFGTLIGSLVPHFPYAAQKGWQFWWTDFICFCPIITLCLKLLRHGQSSPIWDPYKLSSPF